MLMGAGQVAALITLETGELHPCGFWVLSMFMGQFGNTPGMAALAQPLQQL